MRFSANTERPDNPDKGFHPDNPPVGLASSAWLSLANKSFIHVACVALLILVIYGNTLNAPFQWDENDFIVNNPIIKDLHYFVSPSEADRFDQYGAFINRYVGYLTFALNYKIHGLTVNGYHIVNIAVHICNSILIYLLVLLTFRTPVMKTSSLKQQSHYVALFSSLIFAAHPLHTEAVTYVFQRMASLAAFFYFFSLAAYIKSRLSRDAKRRNLFYIIALMSAVLAMKTKENTFTLPVIIALYEFCFFEGGIVKRVLSLIPLLLTMCVIPLTLVWLNSDHIHKLGVALPYGPWEYLFTQFRVLVTYLRLLLLPVNQNFGYDYPLYESFFNPNVYLSFLFLAALFGLGICLITKKVKVKVEVKSEGISSTGASRPEPEPQPAFRLIGCGILWFFITISVESSIVPIPMLINEYRMYLPSAGLIISMAAGVFLLKERIKVKPVVLLAPLVLVVTGLSVATHLRNDQWRDQISLWEDIVAKSPRQAVGHVNLGNVYNSLNMTDKAVEQYQIAIRLNPGYAKAYYSLGVVYASLNMPGKAIEYYLTALKLDPGDAEAHNNLGTTYGSLKMPDKAMEQFLIAIKLNPGNAEAHNNLGVACGSLHMPDKAIEQYQIAAALKPDFAEAHYNLGVLYYKMGEMEKTRKELMAALAIKPDYRQAKQLMEEVNGATSR